MSANTVPGAAPPPWLATVLLARDDTEESVMGTHLHQRAIIMAYGALRDYAAALTALAAVITAGSSQRAEEAAL